MLRFNIYQRSMVCLLQEFQYILCYGSTRKPAGIWKKQSNFNTSYVTVQRFLIAIFRTEKVISIHLMLRFNLPHLSAAVFAIIFQYILCYGSTLVISNIDVCRTKFQYILCYGSTCVWFSDAYPVWTISIHLMLRFNAAPA